MFGEERGLMLPRRGTIEIELLRRYGRAAAGTRAAGWVTLSENDHPYFTHVRELHIRVSDDPRVVGGPRYFPWAPPPGASPADAEARLLDQVLREVVSRVEEERTPAKHQRFRVVRAEWQD